MTRWGLTQLGGAGPKKIASLQSVWVDTSGPGLRSNTCKALKDKNKGGWAEETAVIATVLVCREVPMDTGGPPYKKVKGWMIIWMAWFLRVLPVLWQGVFTFKHNMSIAAIKETLIFPARDSVNAKTRYPTHLYFPDSNLMINNTRPV